jgi:hypothetical protein
VLLVPLGVLTREPAAPAFGGRQALRSAVELVDVVRGAGAAGEVARVRVEEAVPVLRRQVERRGGLGGKRLREAPVIRGGWGGR